MAHSGFKVKLIPQLNTIYFQWFVYEVDISNILAA